MIVSIIAAMAQNRVIGRKGGLPWRLPADLRRFRTLTLGHHIIMGRKTYESIGKPLPGRESVVITRQIGYEAPRCLVVHSLKQALEVSSGDEEIFIIGGAQIFKQALEVSDRIYLTLIHEDFEGDVYFPEFAETSWNLVSKEDHQPSENNPHSYSFLIFERQASVTNS